MPDDTEKADASARKRGVRLKKRNDFMDIRSCKKNGKTGNSRNKTGDISANTH